MNLNRTKILATVGPSCDTIEKLQSLSDKGVSCFRINMSHGTQENKRAYIQTLKKVKTISGDRPTLLADLAGPKIRVNAISPGPVPTEVFMEALSLTEEMLPGLVQQIGIPMQRMGKEDDMSGAAVYLASPASAWVTGHILSVTGGL